MKYPEALKKRPLLILAAILILGFLLRVHCLGCESLWLDEGFSIDWIMSGLLGIIKSAAGDVHPPLYYITLLYWTSLFGLSEFSVRSLSLVFSVASIILLYRLCDMILDRKTAVISSLLIAVSTFQIYFSQEARPYAMVMFLTILSMFLYLRLFEKGRWNSVSYVLVTTLMLYTHIFSLFIVLAQNIHFFYQYVQQRGNLKRWIIYQATLFILFLPWFLVLLFQALNPQGSFGVASWIPVPTLVSIIQTLFEYSGYYYLYPYGLGTVTFLYLTAISFAVSIIVLLLAMIPAISLLRGRKPPSGRKAFLFIWLLTPIAVPFIISYIMLPIYWVRFTSVASPAYYILAAIGIRSLKRRHIRYLLIAAIIILSLLNAYRFHSEINKEQWRETAGFIDGNYREGDLLIFYKSFAMGGPIDYYLRSSPDRMGFPESGDTVDDSDLESLRETMRSNDRVWLVLSQHLFSYDGTTDSIIETIEETHEAVEYESYVGIELYLFVK
jgi:uncharacterized membrane protein